MLDYAGRANADTRLTVLIEHPRAIENLDDILAVDGLGGALLAPLDLAVNMGFSDGLDRPEFQAIVAHAWQKIAARGFRLMSFAVTPEQGRAALARGARTLFLGFDTMLIPVTINNWRLLHSPSQPPP
jgi:2-keto-3-deoxy-L-rhamnonate aldolase RhmA